MVAGPVDHAGQSQQDEQWNHDSDERFYEYYVKESLRPETLERFSKVKSGLLNILGTFRSTEQLEVADIGCGPGVQSLLWAGDGHRVHGLDVNRPLLEYAQAQAEQGGLDVDFQVGTAAQLPWEDGSMDVCLVPELLEHVPEWRQCVDECVRILRPGGILYLSTSNRLCPVQQEFRLPLYSWYPAPLKRRYERLSVTTRPELVNYATYPAVNWFSYGQLRREFAARGVRTMDRFDFIEADDWSAPKRAVLGAVRLLPPLRFLGQVATPYTLVIGIKDDPAG